jgi:hypothetical protein
MSNFKFKILPREFPQHFKLPAVYPVSLLDSVIFQKLENNIFKLATSKPPFCFQEGDNCVLVTRGATLHLIRVM